VSHSACCPRCDYDLSGVAESWKDACPLDGVCSECGLAFRWPEILNPLLTVPAWSFEHAMRQRPLALLRTAARTFRPRRLWAELRMEHPVRVRRLLTVPLLAVPAAWAVMALAIGMLLLGLRALDAYHSYGGAWNDIASIATFGFATYGWGSWQWVGPPAWLVVGAAWWCVLPAAFLTLPVTLRRAKVRPLHLARIWVYSLTWLPLALTWWWFPEVEAQVSWVVYDHWPSWLMPALHKAWGAANDPVAGWRSRIFIAATAISLTLVWRCAIRRYLRLPHSWGIAVAAVAMSGAVVTIIAVLIPGVGEALAFDL
jgi:hypothetical protein